MKISAMTKVDAGEIGAGHTVTAPMKWCRWAEGLVGAAALSGRCKTDRKAGEAGLAAYPLQSARAGGEQTAGATNSGQRCRAINQASEDLRFAAAVAAFAQQLKGEKYTGRFSLADSAELALNNAKGDDRFGLRAGLCSWWNWRRACKLAIPVPLAHEYSSESTLTDDDAALLRRYRRW